MFDVKVDCTKIHQYKECEVYIFKTIAKTSGGL